MSATPRAGTTRRLLLAFAATVLAVLASCTPASALPNTYDGVQLHSLWYDSWQTDTVRDLDKAKQVGSNVVRLDVGWQSLQPAKGEYSQWYVDRLDTFMAAARARGMKVVATLHLSPCWASSAPDSVKQSCTGDWWTRNVGLYPPTDPADYATAAAWVARRYAASLAALEIWNEPNDDRYLTSADNAADYVRLVKAAYPAVKAAAPGVAVLAGAIQYSDRPFLQQLYAKGMKGYYDGLSIHPYAPGIAPTASNRDTSHSFRDGINWIRQGQQAAGDSAPLWLTEFGWSTCSGNGACVSEAQQATYTAQAMAILKGMSFVKGAIVYNLREKGSDASSQEDKWGLVRGDYSAKPGFAALRSVLVDGKLPAIPSSGSGSGSGSGSPSGAGSGTGSSSGTTSRPGATSSSGTTATGNRTASSSSGSSLIARLKVKIVRKGKRAYAKGKGPAKTVVSLRASKCKASKRLVKAKTGKSGRFTRKLGSYKRFRGCKVKASAAGLAVAASVR